jgi:sugar lactone lactonase YvrE
MTLGTHRLEYEVLEGWERLPEGWSFVEVAGVAVDSRDRVYVFNRGQYPMIVFDKDGRFLNAWGEGVFANPHGLFIDADDHVYCVDNHDHTVRKFTTEGELLMTLGDSAEPADTGFQLGESPVQRAGGPFNMVTNVAVAGNGEMFVSDGYGNARVHRFSASGELLASWGEPGSAPGQFNLPHAIAVDRDGRVFVADRENSRIQIFAADGTYLKSWDWLNRPDDLFIDAAQNLYIAELGWALPYHAVPHYRTMTAPPVGHAPIARVTICDLDGRIQTQIGGFDPVLPGNFIAPHGIWADSRGDFYVGEVVKASGAIEHFAPLTCHAFQKFVRSG